MLGAPMSLYGYAAILVVLAITGAVFWRTDRYSRVRQLFQLILVLTIVIAVSAVLFRGIDGRGASVETPNEFTMQLSFNLSRKAIIRTVQLSLCPPPEGVTFPECSAQSSGPPTRRDGIAAPNDEVAQSNPATGGRPEIVSAGLTSDMFTTDHGGAQFPSTQVSVTASNIGTTGLLITVRADPTNPDRVPDGRYTGTISIQRRTGGEISYYLRANLSPRGGSASMVALGWLTVGAAAGGLAKWTNETFAPLASLRRRYRRLQLDPQDLPVGAAERIRRVQDAIRSGVTDGVAAELDLLEKNRDALSAFAHAVSDLRSNLMDQRRRLESTKPAVRHANAAIYVGFEFLHDLLARPWPWPPEDTIADEYGAAQRRARIISSLLREIDSSDSSAARQELENQMQEIIGVGTDWFKTRAPEASGSAKSGTLSGESPQPVVDPTSASVAPASRPQQSLGSAGPDSVDLLRDDAASDRALSTVGSSLNVSARTILEWLLDHATWITAILAGAVVVFVGYQTQFLNDVGFSGELSEYVQLAAWAFALQVTGVTMVELAGRLASTHLAVPATPSA